MNNQHYPTASISTQTTESSRTLSSISPSISPLLISSSSSSPSISSSSSSSSISSSSLSILPLPSEEQQEAISAILSGKCLTIAAVAGSGKTTTMLQIASNLPPDRKVTIVTYNRSLKDECRERIQKLQQQQQQMQMQMQMHCQIECYTIHGLVSKVAQRTCSDDFRLNQMVQEWEKEDEDEDAANEENKRNNHNNNNNNKAETTLDLDILMLDEAQDLRPSFYKALCHIIRKCSRHRHHHHQTTKNNYNQHHYHAQEEQEQNNNSSDNNNTPKPKPKKTFQNSLQMCLVGDPKQMLYDFSTFGKDKATFQYMEFPERYWGEFTHPRPWVQTTLSTSYRLTPNMAQFVNTIWGTSIQGGNTKSPNLPVDYICRYPYPSYNYAFLLPGMLPPPLSENDDPTKLSTLLLSNLIDEYGPENVLFLSQSVSNSNCPIRIHVNSLMKIRTIDGQQKYNFHIKETTRGYEGGGSSGSGRGGLADDTKNKVRVWTFCGSKGCEADCVVVFNLDMINTRRVYSLNQIGVALSRAKKHLVVIHGGGYEKKKFYARMYYPMLGDEPEGMKEHVIVTCKDGEKEEELRYEIPSYNNNNNSERDRDQILVRRSQLTEQAMKILARKGVICLKENGGNLPSNDPTNLESSLRVQTIYRATDFNYFASEQEETFLSYGLWTQESGVKNVIEYNTKVQFQTIKEDVSALYGEALLFMLQWEREGYCPNVETIVNDGILRFNKFFKYGEKCVRNELMKKECEPLSPLDDNLLKQYFQRQCGMVKGQDVIEFLNSGSIKLQKKRVIRGRTIYFPIKAMDSTAGDEFMRPFEKQIRSIYLAPKNKSPAEWIYLANAVMAFRDYHDKWNQVGTDPETYSSWVESNALLLGLSRVLKLMRNIPLNNNDSSKPVAIKEEDIQQKDYGSTGMVIEKKSEKDVGAFECELYFKFPKPKTCTTKGGRNSHVDIIGVSGICDWVGQGLYSEDGGRAVDLLEIKFVHELGNVHRLQTIVYCALLTMREGRPCSGMLFNARTGEAEICSIESTFQAERLLSDISQFKLSGSLVSCDTTSSTCTSTTTTACTTSVTLLKDNNHLQQQQPYLPPITPVRSNEEVILDNTTAITTAITTTPGSNRRKRRLENPYNQSPRVLRL